MNKPIKPFCPDCDRTMQLNDEWVYECSICGHSTPPMPRRNQVDVPDRETHQFGSFSNELFAARWNELNARLDVVRERADAEEGA